MVVTMLFVGNHIQYSDFDDDVIITIVCYIRINPSNCFGAFCLISLVRIEEHVFCVPVGHISSLSEVNLCFSDVIDRQDDMLTTYRVVFSM